jgi:hypothetical protein
MLNSFDAELCKKNNSDAYCIGKDAIYKKIENKMFFFYRPIPIFEKKFTVTTTKVNFSKADVNKDLFFVIEEQELGGIKYYLPIIQINSITGICYAFKTDNDKRLKSTDLFKYITTDIKEKLIPIVFYDELPESVWDLLLPSKQRIITGMSNFFGSRRTGGSRKRKNKNSKTRKQYKK